MRSLFDASFLIALIDQDHNYYDEAIAWFVEHSGDGWASCCLTENAAVRILSNPNYSKVKRFTPLQISDTINRFIKATDHEFWPSDISITDTSIFSHDRILGPKQVTDIYLLAMAAERIGCLVSYDQRISLDAVRNARPEHLVVI